MVAKQSLSQPTGAFEVKFCIHEKSIEAVYVKLNNHKIERSVEVGAFGEAIIDIDKDGRVVGIEMLEPGKLSIGKMKKISKEYNVPQLRNFRPDKLQAVMC